MKKLSFQKYDYAGFATFIAYAISSIAVPVVLVEIGDGLGFPLPSGGCALGGFVQVVRSLSMCIMLVLSGWFALRFGCKWSLGVSVAVMGLGFVFAAMTHSYLFLLMALGIAGLGEGVIEGLGTPFIQDLHEENQSRYVSFLHSFWSVGTFVAAIGAGAAVYFGVSWRYVLFGIGTFAFVPSFMILFPSEVAYPERTKEKSSKSAIERLIPIIRSRRFWFYFAAIFFAGGGEYGLTFWTASFVRMSLGESVWAGALGTAAFSLGMYLGRSFFARKVADVNLKRAMIIVAIFGIIVTLIIPQLSSNMGWLSRVMSRLILLLVLLLSGFGSAPFWPGIQSLAVRKMPNLDSTMIFILLSCSGVPGSGIFTYIMGFLGDKVGMSNTFYLVPFSYFSMLVFIVLADKIRENCER